jgi:hypothetical protein
MLTPDMVKRDGKWAGFKKIKRRGPEAIRGWRTVLILLLNESIKEDSPLRGIINIDMIERAFGAAQNANWAAKAQRKEGVVTAY